MNTPQVQVPFNVQTTLPVNQPMLQSTQPMLQATQPMLPAGTIPFPSILSIKNETCTSMFDLVKQYWWVLLLLVVAFLYYRQQKSKKEEDNEPQSSK
jgi:hypothetical protein